MANEITATAWSAALPVVVRRRFIEFAQRFPIIANLVTVENLPAGAGKSLVVGQWPDAATKVAAITDGTAMSNSTFTPTTVTATAAMAGAAFTVTQLVQAAAAQATPLNFAEQAAGGITQKIEDDLAALFAALNGGTVVGTSGAAMAVADGLSALVTLQTNQAVGPVSQVLHPRQTADYLAALGALAGGGFFAGSRTANMIDSINSAPNGFAGAPLGVPTFSSPRCPADATNRTGAAFTPDALLLLMMWSANVMQVNAPTYPGITLSVTSAYGVVETADKFGVAIVTKK